jgi:hypothetical protein
MSDLEFLYAVLAAFYLWECVCWVRSGGVALTQAWGKAHTITPLIGNLHGGFAFVLPLPPLGSVAIATQFPVSLSGDGLLAYVASSANPAGRPVQTGRFLRWNDVQAIEAHGKAVRINGTPFAFAQSTMHARRLRDDLRTIATLTVEQRPNAISKLIRSIFDNIEIKKRMATFESLVRPLRWTTNALFLFVFLVAPAALWKFGLSLAWMPLVGLLLALLVTAATQFRRAHLALYPSASDERFNQFVMILLYPPAAIRACDALSRPLLESFHPLAAAAVLCDAPHFETFGRRTLLDLRHPARPLATENQPALATIEESARAEVLATAEILVRKVGLDPEKIIRPPEPSDSACRAFCPRCHALFTSAEGSCTDCGGVPLTPFTAKPQVARTEG